ncbi:MAG: hypothetical protein HZA15_15795 [Nitrospirae bacterium]|nr:hypothetical protein [Nitrospirota bacterium]
MKMFVTILTTIVAMISVALAEKPEHKDPVFPTPGTLYAEARASLLKQGLTIVFEKRTYDSPKQRAEERQKGIISHEPMPSSDPKYHEIDCWKFDKEEDCRALFLETDERGWKHYIIVMIDPKTNHVADVHYPATADALPSIPPPLAADIPQIKGNYFRARRILREKGFRPIQKRSDRWSGSVCRTLSCKRYIKLPEADCSGTGANFCTAYWISPEKRVLKVTTIGEYPEVYFAEWSSWKELEQSCGIEKE